MKRKKIAILVTSSLFLGAGAISASYFYFDVWRPNQLMLDVKWYEAASQDEQRAVCHKVISHRFGDPHDAFLMLESIGNAESVPLIIRCLKWQTAPSHPHRNCCSTDHGFGALRSLTGEEFPSCDEWIAWWKHTGSTLPTENFKPRTANKELDTSG